MVLSSAKRQGITGSMFGIYPVEKSRSVFTPVNVPGDRRNRLNVTVTQHSRVDDADDWD
jgi:hypothetical protein